MLAVQVIVDPVLTIGLLNAIQLCYVLQLNRPVIEYKLIHLARLIDLEGVLFDGFMRWICQPSAALQLAQALQAIGGGDETSLVIGEMVVASTAGDPVASSATLYTSLFEHAVSGPSYGVWV